MISNRWYTGLQVSPLFLYLSNVSLGFADIRYHTPPQDGRDFASVPVRVSRFRSVYTSIDGFIRSHFWLKFIAGIRSDHAFR